MSKVSLSAFKADKRGAGSRIVDYIQMTNSPKCRCVAFPCLTRKDH